MLFNSNIFVLLFLPLTLVGCFLLRGLSRRAAIGWLVIASAIFYGWFKLSYLILFAVMIVFNYLYATKLTSDRRSGRANAVTLSFGIAANLAILLYFKYDHFFVENINTVFGTNFVVDQVALPLGISFFTFQKIAFLIDAYRGEIVGYTFLEFVLFVMYFPQLIAGPIVHHREMIPQFRKANAFCFSAQDVAAGLTLFVIGLVKKIEIADTLVAWSDPVFTAAQAGTSPSLIVSWSAALAFTFQIYFDFSGYTDMALGLALMMGIRLPLNFNSPYKATSIIDFWRRWHITLSRFLRDYVYIALGGNRLGPWRRYLNLLVTMLIGGLWHGAAWTFVIWGGLHGLFLTANHGWRALRNRLGLAARGATARSAWCGRILTFLAVVCAWIIFRAESFGAARRILEGMVGLGGVALPEGYAGYLGPLGRLLGLLGVRFDDSLCINWPGGFRALWLLGILAAVWLLPNSQQLLAQLRPALTGPEPAMLGARLRRIAGSMALLDPYGTILLGKVTGLLVAGCLFGSLLFQALRSTTLQPFIYFQF